MLLIKAGVLLGIATSSAFSLAKNMATSSTLSTKYIGQPSSSVDTTVSTSWRTCRTSATIRPDEDGDGWTLVSKIRPTQTDTQKTTTIDNASSEATNVRPNNAIVAHRMAVIASKKWGKFPEKPDAETEACINNATSDDGTQGITYDSSTVNCTALMFGDRWHGWKCDKACRAALVIALPAALLKAVGPELADSEAVQLTIVAIQELFDRSVTLTRIARFVRHLFAPNSPLSDISGLSSHDPSPAQLLKWNKKWIRDWNKEVVREAGEFGLGQEAIERVIHHLDDYQGPLDFPSPTPPSTEFDYFDFESLSSEELPMEEFEHYLRSELDSEEITRSSQRGSEELERTYRPEQDLYDSEASSFEEPATPEEMASRGSPGEGPPGEGPPGEGPPGEGPPGEGPPGEGPPGEGPPGEGPPEKGPPNEDGAPSEEGSPSEEGAPSEEGSPSEGSPSEEGAPGSPGAPSEEEDPSLTPKERKKYKKLEKKLKKQMCPWWQWIMGACCR